MIAVRNPANHIQIQKDILFPCSIVCNSIEIYDKIQVPVDHRLQLSRLQTDSKVLNELTELLFIGKSE